MRITVSQPVWGGNPTAEYMTSAKKPKARVAQSMVKNQRPARHQVKPMTEDEKWVLEALYKRLPSF